jgi:hypothetical protein
LIALFKDFYDENIPLFSLNFGIITLLPKKKEVTHIKPFHPICLLNVSFKIFTKVVGNRMIGINGKLVSPSQTAFIPSKNIMEPKYIIHTILNYSIHKIVTYIILYISYKN